MKRTVLLLIAFMSILPFLARNDYRHQSITMDDGLPSNAVRNILQDCYGYIWFGTDNGLCRYDGTCVKPYRIPSLELNQYISALVADDDGLYVGTEQGVFRMRFNNAPMFERLPLDINSTVTHLTFDKEGQLWVSTMKDGLWCYQPVTGQSHCYNQVGAVAQVLVDNANQVWAVTNWGSSPVSRLNRLHNTFETQVSGHDYGSLCMLQTHDGRLWLGSWEQGLLQMHSDGHLEQVLAPKDALHIHTLFECNDEQICVGSDDGAISYNPKTGKWGRLLQLRGMTDRFVYAITSDNEGGLWTGTFYGGVVYMPPTGKRFEGLSAENGLSGNVIARFCEDREGHVWIASDDGGLMCYAPSTGQLQTYAHQDELATLNVHALALKGHDLWIGTYTAGVYVLNLNTGQLRHYIYDGTIGCLDGFSSYAICHDRKGRTWVATSGSLNLYDDATGCFKTVCRLDAWTIDIDEDGDGRLWLSTQGGGLCCYTPQSQQFRQYRHKEKNATSLPDNQVNCLYIDKEEQLWAGTSNGLCYKKKDSDEFITIQLNVPNRNIMGIIEDRGALWLSTERGIVRYEPHASAPTPSSRPQALQTTRFTLHDGLMSEQFQPNAAMKASDGRIYFGTTGGLNYFYPYQIKANSIMPPVYITSLIVTRNDSVPNAMGGRDLTLTKELELDYHDARMLTLSFAALSYCSPQKNQYAYMMEGFDHNWNYVGNQHHATYTNLPSGEYIFRVKATNNDGVWTDSEALLRIVVHPPFWWSWWARLFYILCIVALISYYVHYRLQRAERLHQHELERLAEQKENEVREARLQFFTMIAHEIRTPVSLIIGPLEKINEELRVKSEEFATAASDAVEDNSVAVANSSLFTLHSSLQIIDRNAHRLLELVNQLLDFRKVEQQRLVMHFAPQNMHELLQNVVERFAPTFEQGGKLLMVDYPDQHFTAIVDREAVTKVVSNLLTNANKYSKDEIRLACLVDPDGEHFSITVADNGTGIREEDRQRIFEPFFQAQDNKPGTGIGLNIVKNIVDLHHGTISVASEWGRGAAFKVTLPVMQETIDDAMSLAEPAGLIASDKDTGSSQPVPPQSDNRQSNYPTMLIVDDSEDMVGFLRSNFSERYRVLTAGDGIEALGKLSKNEISIIISDWMMPRMDGAELCRQVRRNPLTSHIPIVMLTAKTDDDSKVKGMDVGADAYIEKPFSVQYLEACIRNILDMRGRLIKKFSTLPLEPVNEIASNPTDNEFLLKMNRVIEENFSNPDLNVNFLADKLNISRSGLFAKIKTLADITPNEMIQVVRLKRAARLLLENRHSVSEVGYMVGFSNPSYFSKCFQKQFGIRPMDYVRQHNHA